MPTVIMSGEDDVWDPTGAIWLEIVAGIRRVVITLLERVSSPYAPYEETGQLPPTPADPDLRLLAAGVVIAVLMAAVALVLVVRRTGHWHPPVGTRMPALLSHRPEGHGHPNAWDFPDRAPGRRGRGETPMTVRVRKQAG